MKPRKAAYFVVEYKDNKIRALKSASELFITQSILDRADEDINWSIFLNVGRKEVPYTLVAVHIFEIPEIASLTNWEKVPGLVEAYEILGGLHEVINVLNRGLAYKKYLEVRAMLKRDYVDNHNFIVTKDDYVSH